MQQKFTFDGSWAHTATLDPDHIAISNFGNQYAIWRFNDQSRLEICDQNGEIQHVRYYHNPAIAELTLIFSAFQTAQSEIPYIEQYHVESVDSSTVLLHADELTLQLNRRT